MIQKSIIFLFLILTLIISCGQKKDLFFIDKNGNKTKILKMDQTDKLKDSIVYTYDNSDKLISCDVYDESSRVISTYRYFDNGKVSKNIKFNLDGDISYTSEFTKNGNKTKDTFYISKDHFYIKYSYDKNGNQLKKTFDQSDDLIGVLSFDNNKIISEITMQKSI